MEDSLRKEMMKKLLAVLLLVMSGNSYAEWTPIGSKDEFTTYVDRATIRRNGYFVKMWSLTDFKTVQKINYSSFLSLKSQWEYDCKEERGRLLALIWFNGQMSNGTVVYNNGAVEDKWSPISPDSIGETVSEVACGKK